MTRLPTPISNSRRFWLLDVLASLLFIAALLYALCYHVRVQVLPYDDAFITYRYVDNFAAGNGLVYNVSERVFGSTTPLYTMWLVLLKRLFRASAIPQLAVRGNVVFYLLSVVWVQAISHRLLGRRYLGLALGAIFGFNATLLAISSGGMESFLFVALVLGALWGLLSHRLRLAAALAGLATVTRPEGILIVALVGFYWLVRDRTRDGWLFAFAFGPGLLWVVWATSYYGTPIPHSIVAKNMPLYLLPRGFALHEMLIQMGYWTGSREWGLASVETGLIWLIPPVVGSMLLLRPASIQRTEGWLLPLGFWPLFAFYALANTLMFDWYYPSLFAMWFLLVAVGFLSVIVTPDPERGTSRRVLFRFFGATLALLGLTIVAAEPIAAARELWKSDFRAPDIRSADRIRIEAYERAAKELNALGVRGASLAGPEIGALGYYYDGHVYDAAGLVSPQALPFMPVPLRERTSGVAGAISTAFVEATRPDYVVTMPTFSSQSVDTNAWFQRNYRLQARLPLPEALWGSTDVLVYAKATELPAVKMVAVDTSWADHVKLGRLSIPADLRSGQVVEVTLFWTPDGQPAGAWKVFVHLLDSSGALRAQEDSLPEAGRAATQTWQRGQTIVDLHLLKNSESLPPGEYRLSIGLYDEASGIRLTCADGSDSYLLEPPLVVRP